MERTPRHYKLLKELGRGSAGVIHLALDVNRNQLVALKHLSPSAVDSHANAMARFKREVRILSRLDHPNLVRVDHCGRSSGRPYFAMDYVEGQTLNMLLAKGSLSLRNTLKISERLASALNYIHEHGIVHRDVKPSNILLDSKRTPMLVDFGLAHDKSEIDLELTSSGTAVGTLRYSSPEQCAGDSHIVDGAADLYSLGLVLATCLTRRFPKCPKTMQDLRGRFEREYRQIMIRKMIPEEIQELCAKAMAYDKRKRYETCADLRRELRRILRELRTPSSLAKLAS